MARAVGHAAAAVGLPALPELDTDTVLPLCLPVALSVELLLHHISSSTQSVINPGGPALSHLQLHCLHLIHCWTWGWADSRRLVESLARAMASGCGRPCFDYSLFSPD